MTGHDSQMRTKAHLQQDQAIKVAAAHETRQIGHVR